MEEITRVDRLERTDQWTTTTGGGVRLEARSTRTGVLVYRLADGTERREYRPPEEVHAPESLATWADVPVTVAHPEDGSLVTASTWSAEAVGHVSGAGAVDPEDPRFVRVAVVVSDADAVGGVLAKEIGREVSAGYLADYDPTPGTTPEGEPYDGIQRRIRYNHLALLRAGQGRAGPDVRILLDAADPATIPDMTMIKIDGLEVVQGSAEHVRALEARAERERQRADSLEANAKRDAHVRASMIATLRTMTGDPRRLDAADPAAAATSTEDVMASILKMAAPEFDTAGKSSDYLLGAVAMLVATGGAKAPSPPAPAADAKPPAPTPDPARSPSQADVARDSIEALRHGPAPRTDSEDDPIAAALAERKARANKKGGA